MPGERSDPFSQGEKTLRDVLARVAERSRDHAQLRIVRSSAASRPGLRLLSAQDDAFSQVESLGGAAERLRGMNLLITIPKLTTETASPTRAQLSCVPISSTAVVPCPSSGRYCMTKINGTSTRVPLENALQNFARSAVPHRSATMAFSGRRK